MPLHPARRMWRLTEPYHALVYFAPEAREELDAAGMKGFWMGYFASRAAAMGPADAPVVTATFYNFNPRMVARAIPDAWRLALPTELLEARLRAADRALRRMCGDEMLESAEVAEAAELAARAVEACAARPQGRPLGAAHAEVALADEPHLVLWQAITALREWRGDGHVAALVGADVGAPECHLLLAARGAVPAEVLRTSRHWSEEDWGAALDRLRTRGWLDGDGAFTDAGRAVSDAVEDRTDELAMAPWNALGANGCERLASLLQDPLARISASGAVPFPNPMGLDKRG
ncbi:MAG: hypothetical protein QOG87_3643 [Actinomycetota bacterium]